MKKKMEHVTITFYTDEPDLVIKDVIKAIYKTKKKTYFIDELAIFNNGIVEEKKWWEFWR